MYTKSDYSKFVLRITGVRNNVNISLTDRIPTVIEQIQKYSQIIPTTHDTPPLRAVLSGLRVVLSGFGLVLRTLRNVLFAFWFVKPCYGLVLISFRVVLSGRGSVLSGKCDALPGFGFVQATLCFVLMALYPV